MACAIPCWIWIIDRWWVRGDDYRFSGEKALFGVSQKKLGDDEVFIKSVMQSQETREIHPKNG
jgi:hypothetical protein